MNIFADRFNVWVLVSWGVSAPFIHRKIRTLILRLLGLEIDRSARIAQGVFLGSRKLVMEKNSFINIGCFIDGSDFVFIGDYVRLGPYVKILTGSHVYNKNVLRLGPFSEDFSLPVKIERGCWIGIGAVILPGVVIKEGCVIAAGSVVVESTEQNGLYAGVPAKRIKNLPIE